ncbi:MAG TPA: Bax inhibitor-1/YccA family protein, partial [Alphaproteobacteria bacterium]|nr:Bax inhibitor-1/YccA family protein [Alphaproteobacteria bacterium]
MADELLRPSVAGTATPTYDAGLRAHMQRVFNYMAGGLALTGVLAFVVANTALAGIIFGTPLKWVAIFSPFVFVMWLQVRIQHMSAAKARTLFWLFCGTMGLSMASIFLVFTGASVARAFFITSATFAAMSLYGYTTKRNLIGLGAFFMMGMIGLMIAIVVNLFLMSSMLQWL